MNESPNYPAGDPRMGTEAPQYGDPAATTGTGGAAPPGTGPFTPGAGPAYTGTPYPAGAPGYGYVPVPPPPGTPNPATAFVLGFIPGVGAMYNGQFAKGLAHIVIFAVFISLANHVSDLFGLMIAGWIAYMVFDAYQTARARRDGLVAPDPFGLNNIGERLGIGHGPNWSDFVAKPAPGAPSPDGSGANSPYGTGQAAYQSPDFRAEAGSAGSFYPDPSTSYATGAYAGAAYATGNPAYAPGNPAYPTGNPAYAPGVPGYAASPNPFSGPYAGAYAPPAPGPIPAPDPAGANRSSSLPTGAIVLIGLGVLALISTLGHEYFWPSRFIGGIALVLIGGALVFRRLQEAQRLYPSNTAAASWFSIRNSKGGVFLAAIGIIVLLSAAHWHAWFDGWPYLLILLGLYQIVERAAYNRMAAATTTATAYPAPAAPGTVADPGPTTPPTRGPGSLSITPRPDVDASSIDNEGGR